jgi:hypothetical protein
VERLTCRLLLEIGMAVFGLTMAVPAAGAQTSDVRPDPPAIGPLRSDEDYSYLRDPGNRSGDWWERWKFISLDELDWAYLVLGDEERLR